MATTRNDRVRDLLKTLKINEMELSAMMGKPPATIYRITKNEVKPSRSTLELMANKTGYNPDFLISGNGEKMKKDLVNEATILQRALIKLEEQLDKKDSIIELLTNLLSGGSKNVNFLRALNGTGLIKKRSLGAAA